MKKQGDSEGNRGCQPGIPRRDFIRLGGAGALSLLASRVPIMAGPFEASDFDKLVPADKKLDAAWVKSLFARGTPTIYRGEAELKYIGMPIGGITSGQLDLGGDGKLWLWDIFNQHVAMGTNGAPDYAHPPLPNSPIEQGFSLRIDSGGELKTYPLDRTGFPDVSFCGQYPIGTVQYKAPGCPLEVTLEAFSPFIPLDVENSSLPATVLQYTVRNSSTARVEATLAGLLENAVCLQSRQLPGICRNRIVRTPEMTFLSCTAEKSPEFEDLEGYGALGLALLGPPAEHQFASSEKNGFTGQPGDEASAPFSEKLLGAIGRKLRLEPRQSATVTFVLAWHFPNLQMPKFGRAGRHYAAKFASAQAVAQYVASRFDWLSAQTHLWRDTWYDSTLPYWFLDRTLMNISTLATSTAFRFENGRFYGNEGVGCCAGTCTHVWHYEQAMGRLFPELDILLRERADFDPKAGFAPDGGIGMRAEFGHTVAVDGQAGCILRAYRDHQMSADMTFLNQYWPRIKKAIQYLMRQDGDGDGILKGAQHNTLDAAWYGQIPWLSSLYLAALHAGEAMATEMNDDAFAAQCRAIHVAGASNFVARLWKPDYGYFIQVADPAHKNTVGAYDGCEIDQVFGQNWAFQVGLGRVIPAAETKQALASIWKFNFTPDVGPYRRVYKSGDWYAMAGEGGVLICTWPFGEAAGLGQIPHHHYFNECQVGYEDEVAAHMIWEGLVMEGFAIERTLHDRYHAARRNPWNEVECGDHYARSMASYGLFTAACGYAHHGPKGYLAFAPRISPQDFRAAFTSAEGWGSFSQKITGTNKTAALEIKWGKLRLKTFALAAEAAPASVRAQLDGKEAPVRNRFNDGQVLMTFEPALQLAQGHQLQVTLA